MAGIGKRETAHEFAKALNCDRYPSGDACDRCAPCRKFDSGNHPDFMSVAPDGASIKIGQIRALRERVGFRPFEGRYRSVVIEDAQDLLAEASNALLKVLEEPPRGNVLILLTLEPQMLLPTIVSRCCHLRFQPLSDERVARHLQEHYGMEPERAQRVAAAAEGSLERAGQWAEAGRAAQMEKVFERLERLPGLNMMDFFRETSEWAKQSEDLEADLECIKLWLRDLAVSRVTGDEREELIGTGGRLRRRFESVGTMRLFELFERLEDALRRLQMNANKQLTLESVALAIREELHG
jgi:DNA polymerase-3 subunit delta'